MKINTDSIFLIGNSHKVCEDYALTGCTTSGLHYAIISDGCSSSSNTDIGSRILARTTEHYLRLMLKTPDAININNMYEMIGRLTIISAYGIVKHQLHLEPEALDATLIIAFQLEKNIITFTYGDGVILFKTIDNKIGYEVIEYSENAPYYLSYWNDKGRASSYRNMIRSNSISNTIPFINLNPGNDIKIDIKFPHNEEEETFFKKYDEKLIKIFNIDHIKDVVISTDGILSSNLERNILTEVLSYKNTNGAFLQRRIKRILLDNEKIGYKFYDDLGLASIIRGNNV